MGSLLVLHSPSSCSSSQSPFPHGGCLTGGIGGDEGLLGLDEFDSSLESDEEGESLLDSDDDESLLESDDESLLDSDDESLLE